MVNIGRKRKHIYIYSQQYLIKGLIFLILSGCSLIDSAFNSENIEVIDLVDLSEAQQKHFELSMHYIDSAHYDIAESKLLSVVEEYPGFPEAYNALGVIYERRGRVTESGEAFYRAIRLNPDYDIAINNYSDLKCYVADGDAIQLVAEEAKDYRVKSRLYTAATKCYINKNHFSKGREAVEKALILDDHYALTHLYLAKIQYQDKKYYEAKQSINRFNDLNGYTKESAILGYSINRYLKDPEEMKKYQHVLKTQFNEEI